MKRFYCSTCKKVKHVRRLPADVVDPIAPIHQRIGTCKWHYDKGRGMTHAESMNSQRIRHRVTVSHHMPAAAVKTKSKRG